MKRIVIAALLAGMVLAPVRTAEAKSPFFRSVVVTIAKEIIVDLVKEPAKEALRKLLEAPVSSPTAHVQERIGRLLVKLNDESSPLSERISLYAPRVHFYDGVWNRAKIKEEAERYRRAFKSLSFEVKAIHKVEQVSVEGEEYVAVNYSARYRHVMHDGSVKSGVTHVAVLLGDLATSTPHIYAIKEWSVERD